MHQTVTLSKKDLRRILALRDRFIAFATEMEQHANGAAPRRRRRPRVKVERVVVAPPRARKSRATPPGSQTP